MIRVELPAHLKALANVSGEVRVEPLGAPTLDAIIDAIEARFPTLRGTIRNHGERRRRPLLRIFACNTDLSHVDPETLVPEAVANGSEPLLIIGAMAGG